MSWRAKAVGARSGRIECLLIHVIAIVIVATASACSKPGATPPVESAPAANAAPPIAAASQSGSIVGRVRSTTAAVVVLEPKDGRPFPAQSETPVMDQVGLTFGPEMLFVRTG